MKGDHTHGIPKSAREAGSRDPESKGLKTAVRDSHCLRIAALPEVEEK